MSIREAILEQSNRVQAQKSRGDRKDRGVFYTPPEVVEVMTEKLLSGLDLAEHPYIRVLDPACGTGLFLIQAFQILKQMFERDYDRIIKKNGELRGRLRRTDIGSFIVENNLWGADIDREALKTAEKILVSLAGKECSPRLICCDSLVCGYGEDSQANEFWNRTFDFVVGNPPYIGHKQVKKPYKQILQRLYRGIYKDKSDISYCFFKLGIDLLKKGGRLSFITSRYFMEGPSASGLRKYLSENCTITEISDFYGQSVFQEAGVAACIITLELGKGDSLTSVLKYRHGKKSSETDLFSPDNYESFKVSNSVFREEGWVLLSPEKHEIYSLMEGKSSMSLGDLADSYQGIITGCDRAFILDADAVEKYAIEKELMKPWIKNSNIRKHSIKPAEQFLIYADHIAAETDFPNAVRYIGSFRERLKQRRECRNGVREWYHLQWGRSSSIFEAPKIVYPYKAGESRFAVDRMGYYCSADVYSLRIKKEYTGDISHEYITAILNSRLFEFYFKCYAKKISEGLYDYYPNTVLRMKLPFPRVNDRIMKMAEERQGLEAEMDRKAADLEIDRAVYILYGLNEKQIRIVEDSL